MRRTMRRIMTGINRTIISAAAALLLVSAPLAGLQSCCDRHSEEAGSVGVGLSYSDPQDGEEAITDVRLWIFDESGSPAGRFSCGSASELALQRFHLAAGRYTFVTAANLTDPFLYEESGVPTDLEGLVFRLSSPDAAPSRHALYGVAEATVVEDTCGPVIIPLRRVLSELTLRMAGVPAGVSVAASVRYVASGVIPAARDDDGSFGRPTAEALRDVALPAGSVEDGTLATPALRLMPTPGGSASTLLRLTVTLPGGNVLESDIVAPPMRPSGKYILLVDYASLQPGMIVNPYRINDWTEGWVVNGEILDPDE